MRSLVPERWSRGQPGRGVSELALRCVQSLRLLRPIRLRRRGIRRRRVGRSLLYVGLYQGVFRAEENKVKIHREGPSGPLPGCNSRNDTLTGVASRLLV